MLNNEENGEDCVVDNPYCKIECLRQKMHVIALAKGISHSEVLMISCELDEVLNEFYKISLVEKPERYNS